MKTNTTSLLDIAYKEVEDKLSKPANINKYKQFMSKFVQKNQKELYANIPRKMIYYSDTDVENWFNATGINKAKIKEAINNGNFEFLKREIANSRNKREKDVIEALDYTKLLYSDLRRKICIKVTDNDSLTVLEI